MDDMKREKVIEALEACVLKDPDDSRDCRHCPRCNYGAFITNSCINGVMADCLSLLKSQEPRLVIEADFENADDYNYIPAWCEERIGGAGYWEMITPGALEEKDFRYWTSKPSLKQMEETPWPTN